MENAFKYGCLIRWVEPVRFCWGKGNSNPGSWGSQYVRCCGLFGNKNVCAPQQMFYCSTERSGTN